MLVVDDEPDFVSGMRDVLADGRARGDAARSTATRRSPRSRSGTSTSSSWTSGCRERNGLEVIRALRGEGVRSKMVLMTGWDSETARADARADLCDTVLQKPFKMRELRQVLTSLFAPS